MSGRVGGEPAAGSSSSRSARSQLYHVPKGRVEQAANGVPKAHRQVLGDLPQEQGQGDERQEVLQPPSRRRPTSA